MSSEEKPLVAEEVDEDDFDPKPNARAKLEFHILNKGYQAGSLLGCALSIPYSLLRTRSLNAKSIFTFAGRAAIVGEIAIGIMGAMRVNQLEDDGVEDRVYRLHYNAGQNRVDKFATIGAVGAGLGAAGILGNRLGLVTAALGGAAFGASSGVLLHVATHKVPEDRKLPNRMIEEIRG